MDWRPYFCGFCFGVYPILAARSKLNSGASFFAFSIIGLAFALMFFAQTGSTTLRHAAISQLLLITVSGCASFVGLLWMFKFLADTPENKTGALVIIMIIAQTVFTWIASMISDKTLPTRNQIIGMAFGACAIYFLKK